MLRGGTPSCRKSAVQNRCVDHWFRTRGMPIRTLRSASVSTERALANHFGNVWTSTFRILKFGLYKPQFRCVFYETFGA